MSGFKKALSSFVTFDDDPKPPEHTVSAATPHQAATPRPITLKVSDVDIDLQKQILADVDATTTPELTSFNELVTAMAEQISDEATLFKSAFAAFTKTSKNGVDVLLNGIKKKTAAIDKVVDDFDSEMKVSMDKIQKDRDQADKLQEQSEELKKQVTELRANATASEQSLSAQKDSFVATIDSIKSIVNEQESKITTYLSQPTTIKSKGKK